MEKRKQGIQHNRSSRHPRPPFPAQQTHHTKHGPYAGRKYDPKKNNQPVYPKRQPPDRRIEQRMRRNYHKTHTEQDQ